MRKKILDLKESVEDIKGLSKAITNFTKENPRGVILIIDEVDKSSIS